MRIHAIVPGAFALVILALCAVNVWFTHRLGATAEKLECSFVIRVPLAQIFSPATLLHEAKSCELSNPGAFTRLPLETARIILASIQRSAELPLIETESPETDDKNDCAYHICIRKHDGTDELLHFTLQCTEFSLDHTYRLNPDAAAALRTQFDECLGPRAQGTPAVLPFHCR